MFSSSSNSNESALHFASGTLCNKFPFSSKTFSVAMLLKIFGPTLKVLLNTTKTLLLSIFKSTSVSREISLKFLLQR